MRLLYTGLQFIICNLKFEQRKEQTWIDLSIVRHTIRIDNILEDFRVFVSHIVSRRNSLEDEKISDGSKSDSGNTFDSISFNTGLGR